MRKRRVILHLRNRSGAGRSKFGIFLAGLGLLALGSLSPLLAQTGRVTGQVTSRATAQPLLGAQVSVEGTVLGTLTDADGRFVIPDVPAGDHTISVRLIGYGSDEREVTVEGGVTATVNFELRTRVLEMDEIVVTGQATGARRKELGSAVSQISSEELEGVPAVRMADLIQGRATGITVLENSGMVGAGTTIRLRGNNSALDSQQPLVYVDGVRVSTVGSAERGSTGEANQTENPLDGIDPESIERIEVVNGPSATTLYGTEASGGVIQIFTKKGSQTQAPVWRLSVEQGFNQLPHVGPSNDPTELGIVCGNTPAELGGPPPGCPASGSFKQNGHRQKYFVSVSGGLDPIDYYVSGNFADQNGVIDPQGQVSWAARGNFGFEPAPNLQLQFNSSLSTREITWIPDGNNAEGFLLNAFRFDQGYTPANNDSLTLQLGLNTSVRQFTTGLNVIWAPAPGVSQRITAGLDYYSSHYQEDREFGFFYVPEGNRVSNQFENRLLTLDYAGSYRRDVASDLVGTLSWGGQLFEQVNKNLEGEGRKFAGPGEKLVEDAAIRDLADEDLTRVVNGGFFVQGQIGWKDRLFISGGVRVDGHSTFGDDFGLEPYPKAQVAYMISDHDFWPEWWETMKLRGAWGESGRSPGPFDALRTWSSVTADDGEPGVTPSNIGEADLGPEKVREYEAGFESSLFDGRLAVQFSYFNQRTFDALVAVQPVPSEGFVNTQLQNVGEFKNTGTETSIDLGILRMDNLNWDLGFSYSTNNSEALNLGLSGCGDIQPPDCRDEIQLSWRQRIVEGFPIPVMVQERVRNPDAAWDDAVFVDDSIIGPTYPTQSFSLNTSVTVARRLTIRALGEWQGGHFLSSGTAYQNVRRRAWPGQPPGASATCNEIQERQRDGNLSGLTAWDRALCDRNSTSYGMWTFPADFFKLRSASVSYRVPASILPNPIRGATLSISGRNLFTITDYPGVDPEAFEDGGAPWALFRQEYYNLPPVRSFIFTLSLDM